MVYRTILVTGSPRSGTTAVGHALSLGSKIRVLHEPLNFHSGMVNIENYFEVYDKNNLTDGRVISFCEDIQTLDLRLKNLMFNDYISKVKYTGIRNYLRRLIGGRTKTSYLLCKLDPTLKIIIWKDPFACFLVEKIINEYDIDIVTTLRNPWSVAASFKRMKWSFDLDSLINRLNFSKSLTITDEYSGYDLSNPVINGAVLWCLIYQFLLEVSIDHPQKIMWLDLDQMFSNPVEYYCNIYGKLGLTWNDKISKKICTMYSYKERKTLASEVVHDWNRDRDSVNNSWKKYLDSTESTLVSNLSGDLWHRITDHLQNHTTSN